MEEYFGQPCIHCGEPFKPEDDIVSCPECGTPYHRACWKANGRCINDALHASGTSWIATRQTEKVKEYSAEKRAEEAAQAAERERGEAPQMLNATLYDGVRLNPDDPCCGFDPAEDMGGVTMRDMAEFVRVNRFYYLPLFRLMKRTGKHFSFNFICLFFPELYFANRKMWGWAIGSMLLNLTLSLPFIFTQLAGMGMRVPMDIESAAFVQWSTISSALNLITSVLWCMFANRLYYRCAVRQIGRIRKETADDTQYHQELQEAGGTSFGNLLLTLLMELAIISTITLLAPLLH